MFTIPANCPVCNAPTAFQGEYLVCTNADCPARITGAIRQWIKKIGVLHFGEALIDVLATPRDEGGAGVSSIAELYDLDPIEVSLLKMGDRYVGANAAHKAFKNLHAHKELPLHVILGSLGIPLVGRTTVKAIMDAGFDTLKKMHQATIKDIEPIVGPMKAESFCRGYWNKLTLITQLLGQGIEVQEPKDGALSGKSYCFTGFRDAALEAKIEALGGVMKSSVTKDLTVLVTAEENSTSTKAKKAQAQGTLVLSLATFKSELPS